MPTRITTLSRDQSPLFLRRAAKTNAPGVPLTATDSLTLRGGRAFSFDSNLINNTNDKPFNGVFDWLTRNRWNVYPVPIPNVQADDLLDGYTWTSDFRHVLLDEIAGMPVKRLVFQVDVGTVWRGAGSYTANKARCRPFLDRDTKDLLDATGDWSVEADDVSAYYVQNNYTAASAVANPAGGGQCPLLPGAADTGLPQITRATPNDGSLMRGLQLAKSLGYDVGLDIVPNFYDLTADSADRALIYRGLIGTAAEPWANLAQAQAWIKEFRAMCQHYAILAKFAGITPWLFVTGSELAGLSRNTNEQIRDWFASSMKLAAREIHDALGPASTIVYSPSWAEYHADPEDADSSRYFPVDQLASAPNTHRYAIQWAAPLADDDEQNPCTLASGVFRGQWTDYRFLPGALTETHHYLVDGADPSDGLGYSLETKTPLPARQARKNLPAAIEGAHYVSADDIVISSPTVPADSLHVGAHAAYVSPAAGLRLQTAGSIDLEGTTLSNLRAYDAYGTDRGSLVSTALASVYPAAMGLGAHTPPWHLLKHLTLNAAGDWHKTSQTRGRYYAFKLPNRSRPWRVTWDDLDPTMNNIRNLDPDDGNANQQPGFYRLDDTSDDGNGDLPPWRGTWGTWRYNHRYTFEMTVRIDNIEHASGGEGAEDDGWNRRFLAFGMGNVEYGNQPFFKIAVHKLAREDFHHFEFAVRQYNYNQSDGTGWAGRWSTEGEEKTNRLVYGHVYRVRLSVDSTPRSPHSVPWAECKVWDESTGGTLIFNQAMGTSGVPEHWFCPQGGATVYLGCGLNNTDDADVTGFLPGAIHYAGMWESIDFDWGGHFWLDEPFTGDNGIRTSWIPAMKPAMLTRAVMPSEQGGQADPGTEISLFQDDGTEPEIPDTFGDYRYWHRQRVRFDPPYTFDIGGPYGSKFIGDEKIQAIVLSTLVQQMHNAQIRRLDLSPMAAVAEIVIDGFDTVPAYSHWAPDSNGNKLYFPTGPAFRLNHLANGKLWTSQTRSGASGGEKAPPEGSPTISVTPYPDVAPAAATSLRAQAANGGKSLSAVGAGLAGAPGGFGPAQLLRFYITDYGAYDSTDGTPDLYTETEVAAINDAAIAAAAAAASLVGGTVYFPEGLYWTHGSLAPAANQHWDFHHRASLVLVDDAETGIAVINNANPGVRISGGRVNGNRAGQPIDEGDTNPDTVQHGIVSTGATGFTVDNVVVENVNGLGIWVKGGTAYTRVQNCTVQNGRSEGIQIGGTNDPCTDVLVLNNSVTRTGLGLTGSFGIVISPAYRCTVAGNHVYDLGTELSGGIVCQGWRIIIANNVVENCSEEGIGFDGGDGPYAEDCTIVGNVVERCGDVGTSGIGVTNGATRVAIAGNTVRLCYYGITATKGLTVTHDTKFIGIADNAVSGSEDYGIYVEQILDFQITGNGIDNAERNAIEISASQRFTCTSNRIWGAIEDGIEINGGSRGTVGDNTIVNPGAPGTNTRRAIFATGVSEVTFIGNTLIDTRSGTNRATYGIEFDGGTNSCSIVGNHFGNFRTAPWTLDGDVTTVLAANWTNNKTQIMTHMNPPADNTEPFGEGSLRWSTGYFVNLNFSGTFTAPSGFWGTTSDIADVVSSGGTEVAGATGKAADAGHVHRLTAASIVDADVSTTAGISPTKLASRAFLAYNSAQDTDRTGANTITVIDFDTEVYDLASAFAADVYTAPVTGKYHFDAVVRISGVTSAMTTAVLRLVTSNRTYLARLNPWANQDGASLVTMQISRDADLDANDTAQITLQISNGAGDTADIDGDATLLVTSFGGHQFG